MRNNRPACGAREEPARHRTSSNTPGFQDTNLEDQKFINELKYSFQNKNAGIRAICLLLYFCNPRLESYLKRQIYIYCLLFQIENFWEHISIVFTKCYYHFNEEEFNDMKNGLESENGIINDIIDYIRVCTEEINKTKKNQNYLKKIKAPNKLPIFYIDSNLEVKDNRNQRTEKEINELIEWARKKDYLDLQNINKNKIDVNYLNSERIDDVIETEEKFLVNSNILKIYTTKFYAQYKKITFHNEIVFIKESSPYKIEEIKEEKKEYKKQISSPEQKNYQIFEIQHIALKSQKRITINGETKNWEKIGNQSDLDSRIISIDKIEIKTSYEEKLIKDYKDGEKSITKYEIYKIIKEYMNGVELKEKRKSELIHTKTITKEILFETTEKKPFNSTNSKDMKFCEDIVKEKIITEFDDESDPKEDIKEISRKKRYFKI